MNGVKGQGYSCDVELRRMLNRKLFDELILEILPKEGIQCKNSEPMDETKSDLNFTNLLQSRV